jgi:hypothetical protein
MCHDIFLVPVAPIIAPQIAPLQAFRVASWFARSTRLSEEPQKERTTKQLKNKKMSGL